MTLRVLATWQRASPDARPARRPVRLSANSAQSERFGTKIFSETVTRVNLGVRPFKIYTEEKEARCAVVAPCM